MAPSVLQIPVARPRLPRRDRLVPYLDRIDEHQWYSNFGPLVREFEQRLADSVGVPAEAVASVSSGTMGLMLTLRAFGSVPGSLCVMPSWTFSASAHAACTAGLQPYFVDVDEATGQLTPELVTAALDELAEPVGAVMPVAPFGAPLDRASWDRFRTATGIPVVIDAAAAFDSLGVCPEAAPGPTPQVVSLHATKVLGIGEGGFVVSTDYDLVSAIKMTSNFGFLADRTAGAIGSNGKISEYSAAVGLAALDEWPITRQAWFDVIQSYRTALADAQAISIPEGLGIRWLSATFNCRFHGQSAPDMASALASQGIDTRRWWGDGCHRQPAFRHARSDALAVTEKLAASVLGLPLFLGLDEAMVGRVARAVRAG